MPSSKIKSTTQKFTEILDIKDGIIFFKTGNACAVLEVSSVNFYLLSREEQEARMYAYVALLNSLSYYIQILIVSKKISLVLYMKVLDKKIENEKNPKILQQLKYYRDFINDLIKGEDLLDKKIYVIVPFSQMELGVITGTRSSMTKEKNDASTQKIKEVVTGKKNQLLTQIQRLGLHAKQLETDELIKLYYEILNETTMNFDYQDNDLKNIVL